ELYTILTYTCYLSLSDPPLTDIYTLSLHDALPICPRSTPAAAGRDGGMFMRSIQKLAVAGGVALAVGLAMAMNGAPRISQDQPRSEEHTSELQSRENLVCRLLLEKKKPPN